MSLTITPAIGEIYQDHQQQPHQPHPKQDQQHNIKQDQQKHKPAQDSSSGCSPVCSGDGGNHGDGDPDECPGCATGCDADTAHINEKTGEYYKTCELIITYCLWCGRNAQGQDYCDTRCAIAEKRYDDAADYYY